MHPSNQDRQTATLHDYIHVIAKRSRLIIFSTITAAVIAVIASFFSTSIYSATAKILPPQQEGNLLSSLKGQFGNLASIAGDALGKGGSADMYVEILKSQPILDQIIDQFQLMKRYKQKYRQSTYNIVAAKAMISASKKSGIISITVNDKDPKQAAAIANAYVDGLDNLLKNMKITSAGQSRQFLEKRLDGARIDLVKAEEALKLFQAKHKTISIADQTRASIQGIAMIRAEIASQEAALAGLRRRFPDTSQEVKSANAVIENLREQLARLEGSGEGSSIPATGALPELGQDYVRLTREFKTQEAIVEQLTKQYEVAKFSEASTIPAVQVIQPARIPDFKSKPNKKKNVLLVTLSVLFLSTALAFVLENLEKMTAEDKEKWRRSGRLVPVLKRFL
jgi:uncharacterized protein involved in exopolysaccharide biosynthesis